MISSPLQDNASLSKIQKFSENVDDHETCLLTIMLMIFIQVSTSITPVLNLTCEERFWNGFCCLPFNNVSSLPVHLIHLVSTPPKLKFWDIKRLMVAVGL